MDDDLKSQSDSNSQKNNLKSAYRTAAKTKKQLPIKLITSVAVALIAALIVLKFVLNKPNKTYTSNPNISQVSQQKIGNDITEAALTETYNSTPLSLGLKYPKTWKVSEANGGIRIESPIFSYPAANLGNVDGIFRIYIRQGARASDGRYIGDGFAIKPSEKLIYTQPASGQRTDTLLSTFGSTSTSIFTFFLIAGNFQLNQGDTLGPDYGKEPDAYIIAGGYASTTATDELAMNSVALDYYATTNAYKQALSIVASLQFK
jgi:hypothetical protein